MIKPDVIISWPRNCDYPLWRQFIHDNRQRFNQVIVVFTETHNGEDYRDFVRKAMAKDWVLFADNPPVPPGADWRDVAVRHALLQSYNAEWIWFTEQDFFIDNPDDFFTTVNALAEAGKDWVGVYDQSRLHPCCIFIKRPLLNVIKKDFGAKPPHYDHFGLIQQQIEELSTINEIKGGFVHMAGLSHNMRLVTEGGLPNYKPDQFNMYLAKTLLVNVPLDQRYLKWANEYFKRINKRNV
jgi:molybdopterin-guanine dinucleotide biosynthesis protein A